MSDAHETPDTQPSRDLPDLDAVQARIDEAHEAEDHLMQVMPGAIDTDDDRDSTGLDSGEESQVQTEGGTEDTDRS
jgi:hypothetical protein